MCSGGRQGGGEGRAGGAALRSRGGRERGPARRPSGKRSSARPKGLGRGGRVGEEGVWFRDLAVLEAAWT